jgi:hypothetical protein
MEEIGIVGDAEILVYDENNNTCSNSAIDTFLQAANEHVALGQSERIISTNDELNYLERMCENIKSQEVQEHTAIAKMQRTERGSYILQSQKVCIEFAVAINNPTSQDFWLRRLYSVLNSTKFYEACRTRNVTAAMTLIATEISVFCGVEYMISTLKKYWTPVLEAIEAFLKKNIGNCGNAKIASGVLMILMGLMLTKSDRKSITELPFDIFREGLKVSVVLITSFWFSIPVCKVIDDVCDRYRFELATGKSYTDAILPTVRNIAKPWLSWWFATPTTLIPANDLYPDEYCHDSFLCPITSTILEDPVILHGMFFSRAAITNWLRRSSTHPFTRQRAVMDQLTTPTEEFMQLYTQYVADRKQLLLRSTILNNK